MEAILTQGGLVVMPYNNGEILFDVRGAAGYIGVGQTTLRRLIKEREIEAIRVGSWKLKIKKSTLDAYLERKKII